MTPAEWLSHLFAHCDESWISYLSFNRATGEKHTAWQHTTQLHTPPELPENSCIWFGVATRTNQLTGGQRGGAEHCHQIPALWVDIDIKSPVHTQTDLPETIQEAQQLLASYPLAPTATINSGHGLQAWWLLDEPLNATEATPILADWGATWRNIFHRHNLHIDNVFDIARVMRLPGTHNHKTTPKPVTIIDLDWTRTYGLDQIDQHTLEAPQQPQPQLRIVPYIGPERPGDAYNAVTDPNTILKDAGFHYNHTDHHGQTHYRAPHRPNKNETTGATIYPDGHTTIWSETFARTHNMQTQRPYDPFGLYTHIHHNGDWHTASQTLRKQGYGTDNPTETDLTLNPPTPLDTTHKHGPPFPLHTLPQWISDQCQQVAHNYQVPEDLPAILALGVLSTLLTGHTKINVTGSAWTEHVNLYLVSALLPGSGKSPVFKAMTAPLTEIETESIRRAQTDITQHEQQRRLIEQRIKNQETIAIKSNTEDARIAETELYELAQQLQNHKRPPEGHMISEDITPEALVEELANNNGRMALLSSEGGVFDMMAGQYVDKGKATNLAVYLQGWSGDPVRRKRTKTDRNVIPEALLTVCVTTQPGVIQALGANRELVTKGVPVRFMYSIPPSLVGYRDRHRVLQTTNPHIYDTYRNNLHQIGYDTLNNPEIRVLQLSADAVTQFLDWDQTIENRQRPGGDLHHRAEWAAKLRASLLRTAALLHIANHHTTNTVNTDTLTAATQIADYWLAHAEIVEKMWTDDQTTSRAHTILNWALEQPTLEFSLRDVTSKRGTFPTADDAVAPLQTLVDKGWVKPLQTGPVEVMGRGTPSQRFQLRSDAQTWLETSAQPAQLIHSPEKVEQPKTPETEQVARVARVARKSEIQNNPPTPHNLPAENTKTAAQPAQPAQLFHRPPEEEPPPITADTPIL